MLPLRPQWEQLRNSVVFGQGGWPCSLATEFIIAMYFLYSTQDERKEPRCRKYIVCEANVKKEYPGRKDSKALSP